MNRKHIAVTGATGFIGAPLCLYLQQRGHLVTAIVRSPSKWLTEHNITQRVVVDLDQPNFISRELTGADTVIHLAARVHQMKDREGGAGTLYRQTNTEMAHRLASEAAKAGVSRFVFVSTVKVHGEHTAGSPFKPGDSVKPIGEYACSKYDAELALQQVSSQSGMELVIVRPPLVYGPGVKGNFRTLLRAVHSGWPLPLRACRNRRSLVGLSNMLSILEHCATSDGAAGQILLPSDLEDLSTPELIQRLASALGRKPLLFSIPLPLLRLFALLSGRSSLYSRLCDSLQVDSTNLQTVLGWQPVSTVDEELARTARWYQSSLQ